MVFFRGPLLQRGFGIGSFFKGITSFLSPLINFFSSSKVQPVKDVLRKVASHPISKKVAKDIKKEAVRSAINVTEDLISGDKDLKSSISDNFDQSKKRLVQTLKKTIKSGQKLKGRQKAKPKAKPRRKKKVDLLDL